jgi:hypothetical protein
LGGYYDSRKPDKDEMNIFRLLDLNRDAYHAALFSGKFRELPNLEELFSIRPYIGHAPINLQGFLGERGIHLIGGKLLVPDDLEGYMLHLEHHGVITYKRVELIDKLIELSHEPPLKLRMEVVNNELVISERE